MAKIFRAVIQIHPVVSTWSIQCTLVEKDPLLVTEEFEVDHVRAPSLARWCKLITKQKYSGIPSGDPKTGHPNTGNIQIKNLK